MCAYTPKDPEMTISEGHILPDENHVIRRMEIKIPKGKIPERLDIFLTRQVTEITRSRAKELIELGIVKIDGKKSKASHKIQPGEFIELEVLTRPPLEILPQDIPLDIVFEDEWLVVINKSQNMVVHPAQGNKDGTLVNALLAHYGKGTLAETDDPDRPGIVHRLDKDTTGVMVVCKQTAALSKLAAAFREHTIEREYNAIVWWPFAQQAGTVDVPLGRSISDRKKYTVRKDGKPARTHYKVLETFDFLTLASFRLETGRTHQIRIHFSHIGHPVFGDSEYGGRNRQLSKLSSAQRREVAEYLERIDRQMLHARVLGFKHPVTGETMHFEAEPPEDFQWLLKSVRDIKAFREQSAESPPD